MIAEVLTNTSYVDPQGMSPPVPVAIKKAPKGVVSFGTKESASTALERWFSSKRSAKTCTTILQPAASLPTKRKAVPPVDEGLAEAKRKLTTDATTVTQLGAKGLLDQHSIVMKELLQAEKEEIQARRKKEERKKKLKEIENNLHQEKLRKAITEKTKAEIIASDLRREAECLKQEKEDLLRKLRDTAKAERHAAAALATSSQGLIQPQGLFTTVGDLGRICFTKPFAVFPSLPAPQVYSLSAKETQELQLAQKTPCSVLEKL